jgi:hypothetical protein
MKFFFLSSHAHLALDPQSSRVSGGAELQVALLARELARLKYQVTLGGGDEGQPDDSALQGVRTRNAGKFHTGNTLEMIAAIPRVAAVLREEKPDYVFVLGWTAWLFILQLLRRPLGYRLGFICGLDTEVNGEFRRQNPLRGRLFEYAMRSCDVRFAMTRLQERLFHQNGMDCGFYRNLILNRTFPRVAQKPVDFLWVARCQTIKNPGLFLDLAEKFPQARFRMICPGEDRALFERTAARASTMPQVEFIERVPYHEVQRHYDAARIFVNTSDWEGWPNSFIQAGQGASALLSWKVRPDSLFDDFQLGFCADGDPAKFFEAAGHMLQHPVEVESMGLECERFVHDLHNNSRETRSFLSALPE